MGTTSIRISPRTKRTPVTFRDMTTPLGVADRKNRIVEENTSVSDACTPMLIGNWTTGT